MFDSTSEFQIITAYMMSLRRDKWLNLTLNLVLQGFLDSEKSVV